VAFRRWQQALKPPSFVSRPALRRTHNAAVNQRV
jgi:hypothetical protein